MRGAVLYAPRDVRCEEREDPKIREPTDAIVRLSATCICGSDLWPYRGGDGAVGLLGGSAPVRRFLPELIDRVLDGDMHPGLVFDLELPLEQVAEGYRAMDERRAIKTLLRV